MKKFNLGFNFRAYLKNYKTIQLINYSRTKLRR